MFSRFKGHPVYEAEFARVMKRTRGNTQWANIKATSAARWYEATKGMTPQQRDGFANACNEAFQSRFNSYDD